MRAEYEVMDGRKYPIIWRKKGSEWTDTCPFCRGEHVHGTGNGHRVAHCENDNTVVLSDGTLLSSVYGYILRDYND